MAKTSPQTCKHELHLFTEMDCSKCCEHFVVLKCSICRWYKIAGTPQLFKRLEHVKRHIRLGNRSHAHVVR
jgi:hypothetical protein